MCWSCVQSTVAAPPASLPPPVSAWHHFQSTCLLALTSPAFPRCLHCLCEPGVKQGLVPQREANASFMPGPVMNEGGSRELSVGGQLMQPEPQDLDFHKEMDT